MASRPAYFEGSMKFLRRKGRSQEDAEDLIQEAMLRLALLCATMCADPGQVNIIGICVRRTM
jgi:hypothetical protein